MTTTAIPDFSVTTLRQWIQPQHLHPDAVADMAHRFTSRPERYHVIDDFLAPDRLADIRQALLADGVLKPAYKLYDRPGWVNEDEFNGMPDDKRFISEMIYRGPRPGREMARSVIMDMLFRQEIKGATFHDWLGRATGRPVHTTGVINLKRLNRSHFLRWHNDRVENRTLCMVLYLHEGWCPDYAGRFLMRRLDGGMDIVEPIGNRLILFDPQVETEHAVEDIAEASATWPRLNYTAWFYV